MLPGPYVVGEEVFFKGECSNQPSGIYKYREMGTVMAKSSDPQLELMVQFNFQGSSPSPVTCATNDHT